MKIVVLEEKREKTEKSVVTTDNNEPENDPRNNVPRDVVKWWVPFNCGKVGTLITNKGKIGMGCGSRACYKCHRKKLFKSVTTLSQMKRYPKTSMYSLVFTPNERIQTRDDVNDFLTSFRGLLRKWERSHDLKFGYWVAECVIKDDEPPTQIICPIRAYNNPIPNDTTDKLFSECTEGSNCAICKGHGYLPSTHLHIHFVVCSPSFYFGEGQTPDHLKDRFKLDFGGRGFYGFCSDNGMGVSKCQLLKSVSDMSDYISKACLVYMAKVQKDNDDEKGKIDWRETQRGVMIASYTYGRKRHRGACGDAYGIQTTTKDYTNFVQFLFEPPDHVEKNGTDVLFGHIPEKTDNDGVGGGRYIDVMTIGRKAQKTVNGVVDLSNVLKKTKLDTDEVVTNRTYIVDNESIYLAPILKSKTLTPHWYNTPVVSKSSTWFRLTNEYFVFGRGSTVLSVPVEWYYTGGHEYLMWVMGYLMHYEYKEWLQLLKYPFID